jgi:brefeldin A-inhibited guanine nucleotide-exchange protein
MPDLLQAICCMHHDCLIKPGFYRMVNGLLKTAQGVPPGSATTLLPPQDATMKLDALKCLVGLLRSMGDWMNRQLRIPDSQFLKNIEAEDVSVDYVNGASLANEGGEESVDGREHHHETGSETSEATTFEQRRAYKLELQVKMLLFCTLSSLVFKHSRYFINAL